jgi:hypothetical protein
MAVMFGAGCEAQLRSITSGHIGCAAEDIQIYAEHRGVWTWTWIADCGDRRYNCSVAAGTTACHETVDADDEASRSAQPGCQSDSQCKGARVCERGRCVQTQD